MTCRTFAPEIQPNTSTNALAMKIRNEAITAPPDLAPFIEGFWLLASEGAPDEVSPVYCCLPNGAWEVVFHLTPQRFCLLKGSEQIWVPEMIGMATSGSPIYWQVKGNTTMFGLVLLPETMELLTNSSTLLRESAGYEDLQIYDQPIFDTLLTRAKMAATVQEMADLVFATLRAHLLQPRKDAHFSYFSEALRLIRNSTEMPNLDNLSGQVYVSKRQLQRTFQDKLGCGPKAYSRMMRFREALHFMQTNPSVRMTDVAYDFGYADQSHFIREFKDFMGQNPRNFFSAWPSTALFHVNWESAH